MKKIVIFSLESINNAGDEILGDTTYYLLNNISGLNIKRVQLCPNKKQLIMKYLFNLILGKVFFLLVKWPFINKEYQLRNIWYRI